MAEPFGTGVAHLLRAFGARVVDPLLSLSRAICRLGVWMGGGLMILSALLVGVEVTSRKLFNFSLAGAEELPSYALAIASAWAFGFALLERAHVRIDSLYVVFPRAVRCVLDILGVALFLFFFGLMLQYALNLLDDTIRIGSRSWTSLHTPLVVPQALWVAGLVLTVAVSGLLVLRAVIDLVIGNVAGVQRLIGSKSATEEVGEELRALGETGAGSGERRR
ncbi:MAG: TRAP transporter small permease subunit [Proteobacteria bacterium]|nr:TRAP transporter small permease subunit [Pseudomonadota bacterium]